MTSPLIHRLIDGFRCLPGIGPKSAQRMTYYLLEHHRDAARQLAAALVAAADGVGRCDVCRTLSETPVCGLCDNPHREEATLCVVETPADVAALEKTASFNGRYFVLSGRLSPLDGVGPAEIGMDQLAMRLRQGRVEEVIIATNPTVEGEATAHYIAELARRHGVKPSRIAHGVPLGGEPEYIDGETLAHALSGRREL